MKCSDMRSILQIEQYKSKCGIAQKSLKNIDSYVRELPTLLLNRDIKECVNDIRDLISELDMFLMS